MPPSRLATRKASTTVPSLLQFFLLYLEPLFTVGGVALILTNPGQYANTMTRGLRPLGGASDWVWTELAGGWLHILFTEAVVLRFVDDLKVWRLLCMSILLSDALYTHSVAQAVGGWSEWIDITHWETNDWVVTLTTWPFVLTRLAIVFGIGMKK